MMRPGKFSKQAQELKRIGLNIPQVTDFMNSFRGKGNNIRTDIYTVEEAFLEMKNYLRGQSL